MPYCCKNGTKSVKLKTLDCAAKGIKAKGDSSIEPFSGFFPMLNLALLFKLTVQFLKSNYLGIQFR